MYGDQGAEKSSTVLAIGHRRTKLPKRRGGTQQPFLMFLDSVRNPRGRAQAGCFVSVPQYKKLE